MRIPLWAIMGWVVLAMVGTVAAGVVTYSQSRTRTQELNEIAPLEEGVDVIRIAELLLGLREPEAPGTEADVTPPPIQPTIPVPTQSVENTPPVDVTPVATDPSATAEVTPTEVATDDGSQTGGLDPNDYEWRDPRRVNILLLGIDQRQGETGPFPTDTIMLLSLHPGARTGAILSIPRDLYVTFPANVGQGKINTANIWGENIQYPGGGPEFTKRTVGGLIGIDIDYYIMINFDAFITFVNAIGEIEVCPTAPIDDPKYPDGSYGIRPVHFDSGCQNLPAERLLEYARTRATEGGDVDRAARQQEVIFAVREKLLSLGGATALLGRAEEIWESVSANVQTDLTFQELLELALVAEQIPRENIRNGSITYGEVMTSIGPDGEDILIPIIGDILALVTELFSPATAPQP
jgi:LCP family protein required for cell wall assembly